MGREIQRQTLAMLPAHTASQFVVRTPSRTRSAMSALTTATCPAHVLAVAQDFRYVQGVWAPGRDSLH